jgi:hypothetical protein
VLSHPAAVAKPNVYTPLVVVVVPSGSTYGVSLHPTSATSTANTGATFTAVVTVLSHPVTNELRTTGYTPVAPTLDPSGSTTVSPSQMLNVAAEASKGWTSTNVVIVLSQP